MEAPAKIEVESRSVVHLSWHDASMTLSARDLRDACVCADCRSEDGGRRKEAVLAAPERITIEGAELRGAYAINFTFGPDGHSTGIFTWDMLRSLGSD